MKGTKVLLLFLIIFTSIAVSGQHPSAKHHPTATPAPTPAPTPTPLPKAVSAYVDTATDGFSTDSFVLVFPVFAEDLHFTDLSALAGVPSQGCATIVQIRNGQNGQNSQQLFLGQLSQASSQHFDVDFVVPAGDVAFLVVYEQGSCVSVAHKLNVSAFYR